MLDIDIEMAVDFKKVSYHVFATAQVVDIAIFPSDATLMVVLICGLWQHRSGNTLPHIDKSFFLQLPLMVPAQKRIRKVSPIPGRVPAVFMLILLLRTTPLC